MNPFIRKIGFGVLLATLFLPLHSCGLGEDSRDEDNRYVYLRFADPAFEAYCLEHWDLNGDGRISRYEAQRVWDMDCSSLGVKTLAGIEEFTALRKLDCSCYDFVALVVRKCIFMEQLNCSGNALISLDIKGLRFLNRLDCSNNDLTYINLATNAALENLWCGGNRFASLDIPFGAVEISKFRHKKQVSPSKTLAYGLTVRIFRATNPPLSYRRPRSGSGYAVPPVCRAPKGSR